MSHKLLKCAECDLVSCFCLVGWNNDEYSYALCVSSVGETFLCSLLSWWPWWAVLCERQLQMNTVWVDKEINATLWTAETWLFPSVCVRKIQDHTSESGIPIQQHMADMAKVCFSRPLMRLFDQQHVKLLLNKWKMGFLMWTMTVVIKLVIKYGELHV